MFVSIPLLLLYLTTHVLLVPGYEQVVATFAPHLCASICIS